MARSKHKEKKDRRNIRRGSRVNSRLATQREKSGEARKKRRQMRLAA